MCRLGFHPIQTSACISSSTAQVKYIILKCVPFRKEQNQTTSWLGGGGGGPQLDILTICVYLLPPERFPSRLPFNIACLTLGNISFNLIFLPLPHSVCSRLLLTLPQFGKCYIAGIGDTSLGTFLPDRVCRTGRVTASAGNPSSLCGSGK